MNMIKIILGILFLILGRRLFWFSIGGLGFILGLSLAEYLFQGQQPEWVLLLVSILIGLAGVALAFFLQRLVVFSGGFIAGGYLLISLMEVINTPPPLSPLVSFLIGGFLIGILMSVLFKWTLVILSSFAGSLLIIQGLQPAPSWQTNTDPVVFVIFFVLFTIGVALQGTRLRQK